VGEDRLRSPSFRIRQVTEIDALKGYVRMRLHNKSGNEIQSVENWFTHAPPKMRERHWKDGRSPKELARSWSRQGFACPPEGMRALFESAFQTEVTFSEAKPECVIKLDDFIGEHRNCDLVVLCKLGAIFMVVNVEAKADEPFGDLIGEYLDRKAGSSSKVPERIFTFQKVLPATTNCSGGSITDTTALLCCQYSTTDFRKFSPDFKSGSNRVLKAPRLCIQRPCRHHRVSLRFGSAKWLGRSLTATVAILRERECDGIAGQQPMEKCLPHFFV
jgi:hypothetical protein